MSELSVAVPDHGAIDAPEPLASVADRPGKARRWIAVLEVLAVSGFPTQIVLGVVLAAAGLPAFRSDGGLSLTFVVTFLLTDTAIVCALIMWLLWFRREEPRALFFGTRRFLRETMLGLALVPVSFGLVGIVLATVQRVAPWLHNVAQNPFEQLIATKTDAAIIAVS